MQTRRRARQRRQCPSVSSAAKAAAAMTAALLINAPTAADGLVTPPVKTLSKHRMTSSRLCDNSSSNCCIKRNGSGEPATIRRRDTEENHSVFEESRYSLVPGFHRSREGGRSHSTLSSAMTICERDSRRGISGPWSRFNARTSTNTPLYITPPNRGTEMEAFGDGNRNSGGAGKHPLESNGTWRRIGDVPSLVVGVGFLLARHRRELRASNERRHAENNRATEEAAAVASAAAAGATASEVGLVGKRHRGARSTRDRRRREDSFGGGSGSDDNVREGIDEEITEDVGGGEMDQEEWREVQEVAEERQRENGRDVKVLGSRRSAPGQSVPSRTSSLDVSLDRCVLPEPVGPFTLWGTGVSASLLAVAIGARIPRLAIAIGNAVTQTVGPAYQKSQLPEVVEGLRYSCRLWAGSFRAWASQRAEAWERAFGAELDVLPAEDWSVCTLLDRSLEGNHVVRYRFGLQGSPNAVLPLELGQEMTLCGLDVANHVVHGSYVPLTPRKQRGYFDIAVRRDSGEPDDGLGSTLRDKEFSRFLDSLPLGDEIAVKPGREGLVYNGLYSPVTDLVLIATGLGVVPMIQMVKELLPYRDSSVSSASVIWLNEKAEDFALYSHVEEAFFRNHRKLDVSCIVERDLFGHQLESNANLREAAPDFKIGTLAAVAGPDFFVRKVADYLVGRGYPEDVIVKL